MARGSENQKVAFIVASVYTPSEIPASRRIVSFENVIPVYQEGVRQSAPTRRWNRNSEQ